MVKTLKIFFSRTKKSWRLNIDIQHKGLKVYQVCSNDDPRLTFDLYTQGQLCIPMHLYGENIENSVSRNVLMTNGWNIQCMITVANPFSYNKNFVPQLSALALGLYTSIKSRNFKRLLLWNSMTNHQISHWAFCVLSISLNGSASLNKMATLPIYGKKHLKIFFSRTKKASRLNLVTEHWGLSVLQVCSNDDPRMTFELFTARSNLPLHAFVEGKYWKFSFLRCIKD